MLAHLLVYACARMIRALDVILILRDDLARLRAREAAVVAAAPRGSQACPPAHNPAR